LDRGWKGSISEAVNNVKGVKNGNGAVFDLPFELFERFMEIF
jgi:hypothetical protein